LRERGGERGFVKRIKTFSPTLTRAAFFSKRAKVRVRTACGKESSLEPITKKKIEERK
jgi:hypothetical protein